MTSSSVLDVNPDIPECHTLRGWFDAGGNSENFQSHTNTYSGGGAAATFNRSELMSLGEVKEKDLGSADKVDYFSTRATVMHLKQDNIAYPACPTQGCNKKVFDQHDGWRCEKCDRSFEKPEYRFAPCSLLIRDEVVDSTVFQIHYFYGCIRLLRPSMVPRFQRFRRDTVPAFSKRAGWN